MTPARRIRGVLVWLLILDVVLLAWPVPLGGNLGLVIVSGHSMDGTYRTGDLLLTWPGRAYDRGDVVVYRVPGNGPGAGLRVVHRVVGGNADRGFVTRGDNQAHPDVWRPKARDIDGAPFLRIPGAGTALQLFLSPMVLAMICAVCVFLAIARTERPTARPRETAEPAGRRSGELAATNLRSCPTAKAYAGSGSST
jgi:signal peptidase